MERETQDALRELFGDPISIYTDEQALADGMLVDLSELGIRFLSHPVNRMTQGLWADLKPFLDDVNTLDSILRTKLRYATYKGDIWQVPPGLWLIENEVGGWTIMKPEDY